MENRRYLLSSILHPLSSILYPLSSGHDVRHADGRQLQRVGIQPTIRVEPTIAGIRESRDEVLEAAITFLNSAAKK